MDQEIIIPKKKKWYKQKKFYIIVVVGLILLSMVYAKFLKPEPAPEYETAKVELGTLTQTVDATGNVESAGEVSLRFENGGRVGVIYKKSGDDVKKGEKIVSLNLSALGAAVAQASANVQKAQADLDKVLAGNTDEYVNSMKAKVDQAKANLDQIKATYDDSIANAQAALETARLNLELSEGGEDSQIVEDAYDDLVALLNSTQSTLSSALTEADNILGIDNILSNDDFDDVLSVLNSSKLNIANSKYHSAKAAKIDADGMINSLSFTNEHDSMDWAANTTEDALSAMKDLMFAVVEVLDNTTPVGSLTSAELSTLKINVQADYVAVNTAYTNLVNEIQAVETAKSSYSTFQVTHQNTQANLDNLKKKKTADTAAYQALVDQSQANYDDAKNPPRDVDVASYDASLAGAQASLAQAVANRNKSVIIAPVDGVIGKIDAKVGEYVSSGEDVVKIVSPHFEIKVDIPETDITKVSFGDEAEIKLDAFGEDVKFAGMVTEIEIGETVIQDVVYYTVTLTLEEDGENEILNGMTADVLFFTEEKENVLYIPSRAVRNNGSKYVRVLKDDEVEEVAVKLGLRGDDGLIEIIEGLEEGQEVIIKVIEN
ncbi:MAG: efflux RND transporter periplasmic adaptor subunit [Candidatus Magasanikbacteria bacterium]|jgi:HlyD family secretion protein|nr:efflux RND transporter periplasmic adaptor subunit [Candidatus Magasanikbacteria bacterium]MBT4314998.1 efflux RND transporter periplasmic adaptor subunit [Candidatus Magasanikbacteria bacterium]MBT4546954.1 efflux RND transporter periplasmic adaptor subunit [Candidatus Magasanikbacteria bacterium]MBT6819576.1 efflux RND transporter periplasmic adaptor subunit [Candidatus Magasanikbacteria bacterium]